MTQCRQWQQPVLMQSTFLKQTTPYIQLPEDMELEPCQTHIQITTLSTSQIKLLLDQVSWTHKDIQAKCIEVETLTWNSLVKEPWTAHKWWLTKLIYLDQNKLWLIIVQDTSWIAHYGIQPVGPPKRTCTLINREHSTESSLINQSHSTTDL